jgi:hypothetical protein
MGNCGSSGADSDMQKVQAQTLVKIQGACRTFMARRKL